MYYYIGYFNPGYSLYVLTSEEIIPVSKFSTKNEYGFKRDTDIKLRPFIIPKEHDYWVHNITSGNSWLMKKSDNPFYILLGGVPSYYQDYLKDYLCDIDDNDEIRLKNISGKSIIYDIEHLKKKPVYNAHTQAGSIQSVHITNNVGEADRIASEYVKEKYDYPDLIIGNNIPKIKLDKEFNYVGKVNFVPFPKRDHGNLGE